MRKVLFATCLGAIAAFAAGAANANDELNKMSQNPKDWVMPAGDYANTRYSKLNQITAANVGKLQVAWTFSTGVLRGHEGGPLVIGNMMYVHTPFPNTVYALDLIQRKQDRLEIRAEAGSERHSGDVLRHGQPRRRLCRRQDLLTSGRHDARRARRQDRQGGLDGEERRSCQGRRPAPRRRLWSRTRSLSGFPAASSACSVMSPPTNSRPASRCGAPIPKGPDDQIMVDPEKTTDLGKPVGKDSSLKTWQGDQWKIGGGCTWGWMSYDPGSEPRLLRFGQSLDLESETTSGRQQVVNDDLGAQSGHRHGQLGLPDDAP